jgi:ketosteroid isomerase-like protein
MKPSKQIVFISIVIGLGLINNLGAARQEYLDTEKKVWQLEERYWECWINEDLEGYMSLLHEGFLGWPSSLELPSDKKAARGFVQNFWAQAKLFAFEMKPAGIRVVDDVAVVHYFVIGKDKDGNPVGSGYRITHTWKKQGGKWQVLGGMSSAAKVP